MIKINKEKLLNTILVLSESKDVEAIRLFEYWMDYLGYEYLSELVEELNLYK